MMKCHTRHIRTVALLGVLLSGCTSAPPPFVTTPSATQPEHGDGARWSRTTPRPTHQAALPESQFDARLFMLKSELLTTLPESPKKLDIPLYDDGERAGQPFVFYSFAKQRERQLGLPAPELAHDEVLLRVWWTYQTGLTQPGMVFEFRKNNGEWSACAFDYKVEVDTGRLYEKVVNISNRDFVPTSGWETLERIVKENEIPTLLTCDHVKGYTDRMRDYFKLRSPIPLHTYSIEYTTPETYRFYVYDHPALIRDNVREAELFCRFLEELSKFDSATQDALNKMPPGKP